MPHTITQLMPTKSGQGHFSALILQVFIWLVLLWSPCLSQAAPRHVYLTWQGDTSTTITVNYQTMEAAETSEVHFDTKPRNGKITDYQFHSSGTRHKIEGLPDGRTIHWVELTSLKSDKTYYFVAGDAKNGFTTERKFQTIPDGYQKLRFVDGGDMGTGPALQPLMRQAALQEPNFAVVGGDIAYAGDVLTNYSLWDLWLDGWEQCMVTPKGFTIPMVLAIGNHEVRGGVGHSPTNAVFYFRYFAQVHDRSYYSRKFGKNFVIYLLDSGHITPHGGEQATWLDAELEADRNFPFHFAVYHVPLYPAYRPFEGGGSVAGRNAWLPIFDKHHLTTGFEHHDHVFTRTKLLCNNQVDSQGTLYLGDGCWGQGARKVGKERRWYEVKAASLQHFWLVDVSRNRIEYRAINKEGKIFDVFPPDANGAKDAEMIFQSLTQSMATQPADRTTSQKEKDN
jgi:purple acid phosphatase-like protein/calcineurin-like phosphoesterase family protein